MARGIRRRLLAGVAAAAALTGCASASPGKTGTAGTSDALLGLTKVATSSHYIVVLNIVGPEEMYSSAEAARSHPTEGELSLRGTMTPIKAHSRHAEAHIYDKATGRPAVDVVPTMTLRDATDGHVERIEPTLMQDVAIGPRDIHFGNNVVIDAGHQFTIAIGIGGEEVTFSGHLL